MMVKDCRYELSRTYTFGGRALTINAPVTVENLPNGNHKVFNARKQTFEVPAPGTRGCTLVVTPVHKDRSPWK